MVKPRRSRRLFWADVLLFSPRGTCVPVGDGACCRCLGSIFKRYLGRTLRRRRRLRHRSQVFSPSLLLSFYMRLSDGGAGTARRRAVLSSDLSVSFAGRRALVSYGSWWVGTRVPPRWLRHVVMLGIFIVVTAAGVLPRGPGASGCCPSVSSTFSLSFGTGRTMRMRFRTRLAPRTKTSRFKAIYQPKWSALVPLYSFTQRRASRKYRQPAMDFRCRQMLAPSLLSVTHWLRG